jgi:hypothetical protein
LTAALPASIARVKIRPRTWLCGIDDRFLPFHALLADDVPLDSRSPAPGQARL